VGYVLTQTCAGIVGCIRYIFEVKRSIIWIELNGIWVRAHLGPMHLGLRTGSPSSPSVGPVANATNVLQPSRLIVLTLSPPPVWTFPRSLPGTPTSTTTREILVVKGGTVWVRINWEFCLRFRLPCQFRDLLHAANLRAEDFFALKNPDGFGRVWTRDLGYLKAARYR